MTMSFARTLDRIGQQVDDELFTKGAQLAVEISGERVLDIAIGDTGVAGSMTPEHVFRVYCTIKPITTLAIARLVDVGAVDLDGPLEAHLPELTYIAGGTTLRHVLTHTAGLIRPQGVEMEMVPAAKRWDAITRSRPPRGWRVGVDAGYSEYVAWNVVGALIERVTGERLRDHLRAAVIDPLGLTSTWIGMTRDEHRQVLPRLGVNAFVRDLNFVPMLFERSERVCTETNPAHGGYTNARDLARLYAAILDRLGGAAIDELPSTNTLAAFCSPARPSVYDKVLDRECSFGLGFMTELRQHAFGDRCSSRAFGHSGNVGTSFAFADPEHDLAVGVVFNGMVDYEAASLRRRALVNALYQDLEDHDAVGREPASVTEPESAPRFRMLRRRRH